MFFRTLVRAFWVFYDNLFKGVILNLIVFGLSFGLFAVFFMKMLSIPFTALSLFLLWHLLCPAMLYYWSKVIRMTEQKNFIVEVIEGFKLFALRGLAVFVINAAFCCIAYLSIGFYRSIESMRILALTLGGLGVWFVLIFLMAQIFVLPIMVLDEKRRIFVSYKKAVIMLMSSPFSASLTGFLIGYLFLLLYPMLGITFKAHIPLFPALAALFPIFLMPFITFTFVMLLQMNNTLLIYEKHGVYPPMKEAWEERNLGNIFRPWEHK
jgi:hypothetical protein